MQLHECLLLAVYPHQGYLAAGGASEEERSLNYDAADSSESSIMGGSSSSGSILLMVQCIISEWGSNAKTNFYIPPEHYNNADTACSTSSSSLSIEEFKSSSINSAVPASQSIIQSCNQPYIHPQLNLPVPQIELPLYYGVLCWSFTLAGVVMLSLPPKWTLQQHDGGTTRRHWFPYRIFAWILILWQSPCSFLADYVHMTDNSPWHVIDRFTACMMMSLEVLKLIIIRPYTRPIIYILYLSTLAVALACFLQGQEALKTMNEADFIFWHSGWHCYPITGIIVHTLDYFTTQIWGQYHHLVCHATHHDKKKEKGLDSRTSISKTASQAISIKVKVLTPRPIKAKREKMRNIHNRLCIE